MNTKTFEVISGEIHITDPCYTVGTWCGNYNVKAKNGKWIASIRLNKEGRVSSLKVRHASVKTASNYQREQLPHEVGVDSGQVGIFCASLYPEGDSTGEYRDRDTFYGMACEVSDPFGIVDNRGVNSSSGYGDGCYKGQYRKNEDGEAVEVMVKFI